MFQNFYYNYIIIICVKENHTNVLVLRDGKFESEYWKNLRVGNLIKVKMSNYLKINKNEQIPADILLLHSSDK